MKSLRVFLSVLLVTAFSLCVAPYPTPPPAHAASIVVTTLDDKENTAGDCSLREAIKAADNDRATDGCAAGAGADTITFAVSGTITLGATLPEIRTPITIDGAEQSIVIDGANSYRAFTVSSAGNLTLRAITVQNGGGRSGAGISSTGILTVEDSIFAGNISPGDGGAIYGTKDSTLTVTGSTFTGNTASGNGGAIATSGTLTVSRSAFVDNTATSSGGGVSASGTSSSLAVSASTFTGNTSSANGGGIFSSGVLTATQNTFAGNSASSGAAIYKQSQTAYLAGNIFQAGTGGLNCVGATFQDNGYNLSSDASCGFTGTGSANAVPNLNLDSLTGSGPGQLAHVPAAGSAAIGAIPFGADINNNGHPLVCNSTTHDQRGSSRPLLLGTPCTAGAIEVGPALTASISANDPVAAENPLDAGQFTVSLNALNYTGASIDMNYSVSGTANHTGADYTPLSGTVSIAPGEISAVIDVIPVDDALDETDETVIVTLTSASPSSVAIGSPNSATVTISDDDTAGLTVNPASITTSESGATASFTVALTSQPTADVTITLSGVDATEGTLDLTSLTFTAANWHVARTVTVTGVDDLLADGDVTYTITAGASGGGYDTLTASIDVTNTDDDAPAAIVVNPASVTTSESGATASFTVELASQPTADMTITLSGVDATEGTLNLTTLPFTPANWNVAQTVTVTGVDDLLADGDVTYTITASASGGGYDTLTASIDVTNTDDDSPIAADDDAYTTPEGQTLTVDAANGVLNGDTGGSGSPLQAALDTAPAHGALTLNADGSFIYTPDAGFSGADRFTYTATDGTQTSAVATVTITVTPGDGRTSGDDDPHDTPRGSVTARDDSAETPVNSPVRIDVLANDSQATGDPLHIASASSPAHGSVAIDGAQIVYTPPPGYSGGDSFTYTAADPSGASAVATVSVSVWRPVPLCADFDGSTSEIIRAEVPAGAAPGGSVFCRTLVEGRALARPAAEIGQAGVLSQDVLQAVDVFALLHDGAATARFTQPITICLQGTGALLYLDATIAPRTVVTLPGFTQGGYTCASLPNAGTVVLVSGAAGGSNPAPVAPPPSGPSAVLGACMVTTRNILNLRETPDPAGAVLRLIPYDVTLTAFERAGTWYYVDYLGERGWISAGYVTPSEGCGS